MKKFCLKNKKIFCFFVLARRYMPKEVLKFQTILDVISNKFMPVSVNEYFFPVIGSDNILSMTVK